jgi:hypothetical protein
VVLFIDQLRAGGDHAAKPDHPKRGARPNLQTKSPRPVFIEDRTLMVLSPRLAIVRSAVTRVSYEETPLTCFRYNGATGLLF